MGILPESASQEDTKSPSGMSVSSTTSGHVCSECDAEFAEATDLQDHYFSDHLVTDSTEVGETNDDDGQLEEKHETDSSPVIQSRQRERRRSTSQSSQVTPVGIDRTSSRSIRRSDLLVLLFFLVLLGIPTAAVVLALA